MDTHTNTGLGVGVIIFLAIGAFLIANGLNTANRKLTCQFHQNNVLILLAITDRNLENGTLKEAVSKMDTACDAGYIFSGFTK